MEEFPDVDLFAFQEVVDDLAFMEIADAEKDARQPTHVRRQQSLLSLLLGN